MAGQVEFGIKFTRADGTLKAFLALMELHMLVQVSLLSKTKTTFWICADIWPLICVDSEMIEEVVPLSKHFVATAKLTRKQSEHSSRTGLPVLENEVGVR